MKIKPLVIGDLVAKIPVIQGGMGVGISLSNLAGAVALHGGVGILSTAQIGYNQDGFEENPIETNLKAIKIHVDKARKIAKKGIIGVNIMVATRDYERYVRASVEAGVDLIISGAGLPTSLPAFVKGSLVKIAPIVSSIKSAAVICKLWDRKYKRVPDLIVVEGPRAGGHLGFSVEQLDGSVPLDFDQEVMGIVAIANEYGVKYQQDIPVVVAGGIYERKDLEHYVGLGASGVQMSTRFVTTYECDAHDNYKQAYLNAKEEEIQIVKSPVGMPGRAIHNRFIQESHQKRNKITKCYQCLARCNPAEIPYCITNALVNAAKGNVEDALLFCGDNAYRAQKIENVADILQEFCVD